MPRPRSPPPLGGDHGCRAPMRKVDPAYTLEKIALWFHHHNLRHARDLALVGALRRNPAQAFAAVAAWGAPGAVSGSDALVFILRRDGAARLPGLPFDWWEQFRLEEKFGFNKSTVALWLNGSRREGPVRVLLAIGFPLLWALLSLVRWVGAAWWICGFRAAFRLPAPADDGALPEADPAAFQPAHPVARVASCATSLHGAGRTHRLPGADDRGD